MQKEFRDRLKDSRNRYEDDFSALKKELDAIQNAAERLYDAVEQGFLPQDSNIKNRVHQHQGRKQGILAELASLKRHQHMPGIIIEPKYIDAFCMALKTKLQDRETEFAKTIPTSAGG